MKINVIRLIFLLLIATTVDSQLTAQDAVIDSLKLEIKNAQEVQLRSFSTSIQNVNTFVSYKNTANVWEIIGINLT